MQSVITIVIVKSWNILLIYTSYLSSQVAYSCNMATPGITEKNELFFRVCELLMGIGTKVMRKTFEDLNHPKSMEDILKSNKTLLKNLPRRVLTEKMQNTLFPTQTSYGRIEDFDITLLSVLFRNICGLQAPIVDYTSNRRSWDEDPPYTDHSTEADLVRLKLLRNTVYGHAKDTTMSSTEFSNTWRAITEVLERLDPSTTNKNDIDNLFSAPLTELEVSYQNDLEVWYLHEQEVMKQLEELKTDRQETKDQLKLLHQKMDEVIKLSKGRYKSFRNIPSEY